MVPGRRRSSGPLKRAYTAVRCGDLRLPGKSIFVRLPAL